MVRCGADSRSTTLPCPERRGEVRASLAASINPPQSQNTNASTPRLCETTDDGSGPVFCLFGCCFLPCRVKFSLRVSAIQAAAALPITALHKRLRVLGERERSVRRAFRFFFCLGGGGLWLPGALASIEASQPPTPSTEPARRGRDCSSSALLPPFDRLVDSARQWIARSRSHVVPRALGSARLASSSGAEQEVMSS